MDSFTFAIQLLVELVIITVAGLFLKSYLPTYFGEKGKNLATKEDIQEITRRIEAVRVEYAKQLHAHELTFDKEFEILSQIWAALVDLRRATIGLRPMMDHIDPNETEGDRKKQRLQNFADSYHEFADVVEKNKPFYPKDVYDALFEIMMLTQDEADEYRVRDANRRPLDAKYWQKALSNQEEILSTVDRVATLIKERVAA